MRTLAITALAITSLAATALTAPARATSLPAPCHRAAALGGPCGCFAAFVAFGKNVRDLWLADAWLRFPRTSPHAGAAAIWPHRHVAIVVRAEGNEVIVNDSWNHEHRVGAAHLVFVEPR